MLVSGPGNVWDSIIAARSLERLTSRIVTCSVSAELAIPSGFGIGRGDEPYPGVCGLRFGLLG
jgi:hypothetical protein